MFFSAILQRTVFAGTLGRILYNGKWECVSLSRCLITALIGFLLASTDYITKNCSASSAIVEYLVDLHKTKVTGQQHKPEEHEEYYHRAQETEQQGRCNRYQCSCKPNKIFNLSTMNIFFFKFRQNL